MFNTAIPAKAAASPLSLGGLAKGIDGQGIPVEEGEERGNTELFGSLLVALVALPAAPLEGATAPLEEATGTSVPQRTGKTGNILPPALPPFLPPAHSAQTGVDMPAVQLAKIAQLIGQPSSGLEIAEPLALPQLTTSDDNGSGSAIPLPRQLIAALSADSVPQPAPFEANGLRQRTLASPVAQKQVASDHASAAPVSSSGEDESEQASTLAGPRQFAPRQEASDIPLAAHKALVTAPIPAQPQAAAQNTAPIASAANDQPAISVERFGELVEAIAQARESGSTHAVRATVSHAEFGLIALRLASDERGVSAVMSSADPDFAAAVQASASAQRAGQDGGQAMGQQGHGQSAPGQSQTAASHSGPSQFGPTSSGLGHSGQSSGQSSGQQNRPGAMTSSLPGADASNATEQTSRSSKARRGILA